jgi:prepilin peptidase CpaA
MVNSGLPAPIQNLYARLNISFTQQVNTCGLIQPDKMKMLDSLPAVALAFLVSAAAVIDMHSYRIPNWLTGLTALSFLPFAIWSGMGLQEIGLHYLTGLVLMLIGFIIFSLGGFGGGDGKLIAACGVWFGLVDSSTFLISSVYCGALLAIAMLVWTAFKFVVQLDLGDALPAIRNAMPKLPYGIALAAGTILSIPTTSWLAGIPQL